MGATEGETYAPISVGGQKRADARENPRGAADGGKRCYTLNEQKRGPLCVASPRTRLLLTTGHINGR